MEAGDHEIVNRTARLSWRAAVAAGLIAGGIIWLLSHGTPWFTSGMVSPTLMGRDLKPPGIVDPLRSVVTVLAQAVVSVGYALIIGAVAARLRRLWALAAGGAIGLLLYLVNFGVFYFLRLADWTGTEIPVVVTHLVFGALAAGLYKGLSARQARPEAEGDHAGSV